MIAHSNLKRLIEVTLALEAINKVSVWETSICHTQPCTLRLWRVLPPDFGVTSVNYASRN
jgi:hypothetical protein